jgi:hypothetical protein
MPTKLNARAFEAERAVARDTRVGYTRPRKRIRKPAETLEFWEAGGESLLSATNSIFKFRSLQFVVWTRVGSQLSDQFAIIAICAFAKYDFTGTICYNTSVTYRVTIIVVHIWEGAKPPQSAGASKPIAGDDAWL